MIKKLNVPYRTRNIPIKYIDLKVFHLPTRFCSHDEEAQCGD
jgi:hypothetical protein